MYRVWIKMDPHAVLMGTGAFVTGAVRRTTLTATIHAAVVVSGRPTPVARRRPQTPSATSNPCPHHGASHASPTDHDQGWPTNRRTRSGGRIPSGVSVNDASGVRIRASATRIVPSSTRNTARLRRSSVDARRATAASQARPSATRFRPVPVCRVVEVVMGGAVAVGGVGVARPTEVDVCKSVS